MNKDIWNNQFEFNEEFFKDQKLDINNLSLQDKIHWAKEFCFHVNKGKTETVIEEANK